MSNAEAEYLSGPELVGSIVEMWQEGKYGPFRKIGKVIEYRKRKSGKMRNNYLLEFAPYGQQKYPFKMWCRRSDFNQTTLNQ